MKKVMFANKTFLLMLLFFNCLFMSGQAVISYSVPSESWDERFGNHRAIITVDKAADAISIDFIWRRYDKDPEKRKMWIINAQTGEEVKNVYRVTINREQCDLVFGPVTPGDYYFYYLPYNPVTDQYHAGDYLPPENAPEVAWVSQHALEQTKNKWKGVAVAHVKEIQARQAFHSFYPMGVAATQKEVENMLLKYKNEYLVFPEDRSLPIRMLNDLPLKWTKEIPANDFRGTAQRNEYYCLQLGVFAAQKPLTNLSVIFSDLKDKAGHTIAADRITCFNTGGTDCYGKAFTKTLNIPHRRIQPLWVGIDVGKDVIPGEYAGTITVATDNAGTTPVRVILTVEEPVLADRGDGETWRYSRLRWLNSTLGMDDQPVDPYTDMKVDRRKISCLGRDVTLNDYGFPEQISSWGRQLLAAPIRFVIETDNQPVKLTAKTLNVSEKPGIVKWDCESENGGFKIICHAEMEFDGRISYQCTVVSNDNIHVQDIRLEIPFKQEYAKYMMGMSRMGGYTPKTHLSRWTKVEDSFWMGNTNGGIQCELRGGSFHGPLLNLYQPSPPRNWYNGVNGGFRIDTDEATHTVTASVFSGARSMKSGQPVDFEFAFLITPVKETDMKSRFSDRYAHTIEPTESLIRHGANIMNVHHANQYNPYINYPFIAQKEMRGLVDAWHQKGWKVKIYYTVRELSNYLTEIWALRSLVTEILPGGGGGGYQWLREHLVSDYTPQWYTHLGDGTVDAAILNSGESRWYNYYIEGLDWLMKNMDIDGLYLDDVSFDRRTLKRIRKVMDRNKPGCLIDLHSNTAFSLGSANQNMELFPYINQTWFGEGFNFDLFPPEFWLVEVSGIPFGVTNDLLRHMSVNPRRGMLFGMTERSNTAIWQLWDEFGITDSRIEGFWEEQPAVTTTHKEVYATAYVKKGKTLIAVGSWVDAPVEATLHIDWKKLGLNPDKVTIEMPEVSKYQNYKKLKKDETILLDAKGEVFLILKEEEERYILTPPPSRAPRINGAKIVGASAGKPFLFTIATSGERPMKFEVAGLPEGLALDKEKGVISGACRSEGRYPVAVAAVNRFGVCRDTIEMVIGEGLALTPHMGWNSWYIYATGVTQEIMEKSAQAMYDAGLVNFGYSFVNIDDGWEIKAGSDDPVTGGPERNPDGTIRTNKHFPDMKRLTAYIHNLGLKAGLYSSPGRTTCGGYAGSYGYEALDIKTFADWGFDFLKYDWCSYGKIAKSQEIDELQKPYRLISRLIRESERDIILNMCQYGMGDVWKWGKEVGGQSWRTTGDIGDTRNLLASMFRIGFFQEQLKDYSGPGGWNDPDYLLFGDIYDWDKKVQRPSPYSPSEHYTCMTLWCMMSAPLIFSGNMTTLDDFTKNILCNAEVIDVNQDKLGKQGYSIYNRDMIEIWKKDLADGNTAIAIFNKKPAAAMVHVDWKELGYQGDYRVRDLWRQTDLGNLSDVKSFDIPEHGCAMLKLTQ